MACQSQGRFLSGSEDGSSSGAGPALSQRPGSANHPRPMDPRSSYRQQHSLAEPQMMLSPRPQQPQPASHLHTTTLLQANSNRPLVARSSARLHSFGNRPFSPLPEQILPSIGMDLNVMTPNPRDWHAKADVAKRPRTQQQQQASHWTPATQACRPAVPTHQVVQTSWSQPLPEFAPDPFSQLPSGPWDMQHAPSAPPSVSLPPLSQRVLGGQMGLRSSGAASSVWVPQVTEPNRGRHGAAGPPQPQPLDHFPAPLGYMRPPSTRNNPQPQLYGQPDSPPANFALPAIGVAGTGVLGRHAPAPFTRRAAAAAAATQS